MSSATKKLVKYDYWYIKKVKKFAFFIIGKIKKKSQKLLQVRCQGFCNHNKKNFITDEQRIGNVCYEIKSFENAYKKYTMPKRLTKDLIIINWW